MNTPKRMDITPDQLKSLLNRVESGALADGDYEIIKGMAETITFLSYAVDNKNTSIKRLLKLLFGAQTEKTSTITRKDKAKKSDLKKKKPGHGKNSAEAYTGAEKIEIPHETLTHKDPCPVCEKGKVYDVKDPGLVIRVTGNAPCSGKVYELQKLRCNLCGQVFTARAPDNIGEEKYDAASGAMIALLKYGSGFPFNRLEQLQAFLGIPLPSSTQWEIVEAVADKIHPVYRALIRHAAQGDVIYNDDTVMKILELINNQEDDHGRKGMYTSGIVSTVNDLKIALFITGHNHAGENLDAVLAYRSKELSAPVQMCDALSRNVPKNFATILSNCLAHARRKFIDVEWNFPDECAYVLETLEKVYQYDDDTRRQNMTSEQRLKYHQEKSGPLMKNLNAWLNKQFDEKKVEPNSNLGQGISYMQKHWPELTLFLREPNAPLDNNLCERALKKAILHRKNSMFYKTLHGAYIGDLFMSLIHTCGLCRVNPFAYLKKIQEHSSELFADPERWLPWNYKEAVTSPEE
ncbi:MAG: transposase [Desulfobacterium sp.]|nr:transposase [Desulfobacterium sp.]